jgi:hypothetical protein
MGSLEIPTARATALKGERGRGVRRGEREESERE